jgi:hypothetical protein
MFSLSQPFQRVVEKIEMAGWQNQPAISIFSLGSVN